VTSLRTGGVIGMRLRRKDEVIAMALAGGGQDLVTITETGFGKRTPVKEYRRKGRGGLGVLTHGLDGRAGKALAGALMGSKDQDVFVISTTGIVIRVSAGDIRQTGRPSQGVRVMRLAGRASEAAAVVGEAIELYEQKGNSVSAGLARAVQSDLASAASTR